MAYPPAYERTYSFTDWETLHPADPKPGPQLDAEYDAVSNALTATQDNLALIQRADGALANDSVGEDQLQDGIFDGIADGITADAEAAAAAAAASASAAAGSATSASASASAASTSAGTASGAAAQAGVSQGIAQTAANDAAVSATDADTSADVAVQAANDVAGSVAEAQGLVQRSFEWAELLTGPVLPAPPGWPEAVDDGMFSAKWWAIRAREYNSTETIDLGTAGTDIGNAFDIWDAIPGNDLGVGLTYATWGTPTQTYVLIDRSNPSDPASWQNITGGPGPPGPANSLSIGTVLTGAPGSAALANITGTSPNQVLNLSIPAGATGGVGPIGPAGPPNALAIGTVTTVPDGTPAGASITGTAPTQTLNLTIPAGPQGIQGIQGIQGPPGIANFANPSVQVGLTAVNGSGTNAMRADGAPALSQAIAPVWTGVHNFGTAGTIQSTARAGFRARPNGIEWGHGNPNGFGSVIGHQNNSGLPFIAFNAEHGTLNNTFLTRGIIGRVLMADALGGLSIGRVALANADDQVLTTDVKFDAAGTVTSAGVHLGPNGSDTAPTYSFTSDSNTGMYATANDTVRFAAGGVLCFSLSAGTAAVTGTSGSSVIINSTAVAIRDINYSTAGVNRWSIRVNGTAEGGGNNGSDFQIIRRDDAGVSLGAVISIVRATGALQYEGSITATGSLTGSPAVFALDGSVNTKIQSINSTSSGMVGTQSNHPLEIRTNNTIRATFAADGSSLLLVPRILGTDGVAATPAFSFGNDTDTGIYRGASGDIRFSSDGSLCAIVRASGMYAPDGVVASPGISFINDPDTGLYRAAANIIDVATGGVIALRIAATGIYPFTNVYNVAGTAALPSYSFDGDPDTGIYRSGANTIAFAGGGVRGMQIDGGHVYFEDGTAAAPPITFQNDFDTGIYRLGADSFGFSTGGTRRGYFYNAGFVPEVAVRFMDGSAASPSLTFDNDTNTGFYRVGADSFAAVAGGVAVAQFVYPGGHPQLGIGSGSSSVPTLTFMSDLNTGLYNPNTDEIGFTTGGVGRLTLTTANLTSTLNISAPTFTTTSSRTIKRETGGVRSARDILSRLRPLLYRLLTGDDREQLGLIAEEVHEVCPQLSDGTTVAYDRLAILLLAAWQDEHAEAA
jgi:hypothetical protein